MERFKDARAVLDHLYRLQITDIRANGRNERDELGAVQSALSQLIFKDELRETLKDNPALGFTISDELEAIYGDYLQLTQHARTGYWGAWYGTFSDQAGIDAAAAAAHGSAIVLALHATSGERSPPSG